MPKFLVVLSDSKLGGRGVRGRTLVQFLKTFVGAQNIQVVTPSKLQSRRFYHADYTFIGVPTSLNADQVSRFKSGEIYLFDYHDEPEARWDDSDQEFLTSLTNRYLKPAVDAAWDSSVLWGCLPLRRSWKLAHYLAKEHWLTARSGTGVPTKETDVGFLGKPTCLILRSSDGDKKYPQRMEWLLELARNTSFSWWGGLCVDSKSRGYLEHRYGELADICFHNRRIAFGKYFDRLRSCRVVLTPGGNARWTYRHYEAIYSRSILVSTDLTKTDLLIPLPKHTVIMVPDGVPIKPWIEQSIEQIESEPERVMESEHELEQYFLRSKYSRQRPLAWERFEIQLQKLDSGKSLRSRAA